MKSAPANREAERGSATIWLLGGVLAICAMCAVWITVALAGLARQHAEVAADLASLAAAQTAGSGMGSPCVAAAEIALRNGGRLTSCTLGPESVSVTVEIAGPMTARATARAGNAAAQ